MSSYRSVAPSPVAAACRFSTALPTSFLAASSKLAVHFAPASPFVVVQFSAASAHGKPVTKTVARVAAALSGRLPAGSFATRASSAAISQSRQWRSATRKLAFGCGRSMKRSHDTDDPVQLLNPSAASGRLAVLQGRGQPRSMAEVRISFRRHRGNLQHSVARVAGVSPGSIERTVAIHFRRSTAGTKAYSSSGCPIAGVARKWHAAHVKR